MCRVAWRGRWVLTVWLASTFGTTAVHAEKASLAHAEAPKAPLAPKVPEVPVPPVAHVPAAPAAKVQATVASAPAKAALPAPANPPTPVTVPEGSKDAPKEIIVKAPSKSRAERTEARAADKAAERPDPAPPSLTLQALHAEISNSPAEIERNNLLKERERIGELAGALDVAQKQLRQDTERLAAYLDEVRKQTEDVNTKRQSETEAATKAESAAKQTIASSGPQPAMPLEVLAKAMKGMKAAQAAAIAERLPLALAGDVVERMPARDAGKMMGLMNPERAAALAAEIASREDRRKRAIK